LVALFEEARRAALHVNVALHLGNERLQVWT
jgi:hypothetical protein